MGRIRWRAVLAGAIISALIRWAAVALLSSGPARGFLGYESLYLGVGSAALLAAYLAGGILAGRVSSLSPGLNGVLAVVLVALFEVVRYLVELLPAVLSPTDDPRTASENRGLFEVHVFIAFGLFLPFVMLLGYLGGRIGGLLRCASGRDDRVVS